MDQTQIGIRKVKISIIDKVFWVKKAIQWGFPGGAVVKNPPANAGDTGLSSGPERSHMPRSN